LAASQREASFAVAIHTAVGFAGASEDSATSQINSYDA
jgi:hypothetical protein